MRGKKYYCCAGLPNACITGASIFMENGFCGGAFASARSSSKICCCTMFQPVPPNSTGHPGAPQPLAYMIFCHWTMSSLEMRRPNSSLVRISAGSSALKKARTSSRNFSSSAVKFRSTMSPGCVSDSDDDFAACLARAQPADGFSAPGQGKAFGDGRLDLACGVQLHELGHIGGVILRKTRGPLAPEHPHDL